MRRRDTLRKLGGAATVGGLGFLAGCAGARDEAESADLEVGSFEPDANDEGKLVVTVTVRNGGDAEGTGHLYVTVEAGDDITRESRELTVAAGATTTLDLEFVFDYQTFKDRGSVSIDLRS